MSAQRIRKPSFELRCKEPLATGIRRIARRQIDIEARGLKLDGDRHRAVHEARKSIKKIRACLRLVKREFGRARFRQENRRLRNAGQKLGPLRDSEVQIKALDKL